MEVSTTYHSTNLLRVLCLSEAGLSKNSRESRLSTYTYEPIGTIKDIQINTTK